MNKNIVKKMIITWLAALCVLANVGGAAFAAPTAYTDAANKALGWMKSQQQPDGSFAGFGAGSTVDAALAIVAAKQDAASYVQGGNNPLEFLESKAGDIARSAGGAGKLLILTSALSMDGRSFGGVNLVGAIEASYGISATGQYGPDTINNAFAIIGLKAAGVEPEHEVITRLESVQAPEGGWAFASTGKADTNTTSVAVQALLTSGNTRDSAPMQKALAYLRSQQNADGGFPYQQGGDFGSDSDANSTAYVVQTLLALGATADAGKGQAFLLTLQKSDGAFQYTKAETDDNAGATYQVVPALLGASLVNLKGAPVSIGMPSTGMPSTGRGADSPLAALAAASALLVSMGIVAKRKGAAR